MITFNSADFKISAKAPENLNSIKQLPNYQHTKIKHISAADKQVEDYTVTLGNMDVDIRPSQIIVDGDALLKDLVGKSYIASYDHTPRMHDLQTLVKLDRGDTYNGFSNFINPRVDRALVGIQRAFRSDTVSGYGSEEWDAFMTAAVKTGGRVADFILLTDKLSGQDQKDFVKFAATLSPEDLSKFMDAVDVTGTAGEVIGLASRMDENQLGKYFDAVVLADGETKLLNQVINKSGNISSVLSAVIKAGDKALTFLESAVRVGTETLNQMSDYINASRDGENIGNFIAFTNHAKEKDMVAIMDLSATLSYQDTSSLLLAVSHPKAEGQIGRLVEQVFTLQSGQSKADLSNFLTIAAHAEKNIGKFLDVAGEIELSFTSTLSVVDTVNFLEAASMPDADIANLTKMGEGLLGQDRSNFFYAASNPEINARKLLQEINLLQGAERSEYLLKMANDGSTKMDENIYMKGLLSYTDYENFNATVSSLKPHETGTFISTVSDHKGASRSDFLQATRSAGENADKFISKYLRSSAEDKKNILQMSSELRGTNRDNFIQATITKTGDVNELIDRVREVRDNNAIGAKEEKQKSLTLFLTAAGGAGAKNLENLIYIAGEILNENPSLFIDEFKELALGIKNGDAGSRVDAVI
ncbi:hypothetical protein OOT00_10950 [Desulfobotulus sp. H1]|uniref:Uncharacterized protein n=1 Tax=Desulfobotulus pelophilus TaxID=2823377 RepID=A0ABT3NC19_9BACT|nr:hypothetical protein [Desulfobotulus pelophilus]MCW7754502.1 hypothetical protein [Desulfobotulus pelophilus]